MNGRIVALSGGVGGAKLAHGLTLAMDPAAVTVIVNTGDDFRHLGLAISPDIDSVVYALSGWSDPVRGWGRREETWTFMSALRALGGADWFNLGDGDLAMHVERTRRLAAGESLSAITASFCGALGIRAQVLPMSDEAVRTRLLTEHGWLDFQDYFVHRQCGPEVRSIEFAGAERARPLPAALEALAASDLDAVIVCPSNPFVSVEPILALPGMRDALRNCAAPVIAVTPIIGGQAVKGPAAKMMRELALEVTGEAIARRYADFIDAFVVDASDPPGPARIEDVQLLRAPTLMSSDADRARLAAAVVEFARVLR